MDYSDHPPVIIVASSSAALVRARTSVEACGARIGAALGLSEACDRLRLQPGLRAVWIELDEDCGHEIDELLLGMGVTREQARSGDGRVRNGAQPLRKIVFSMARVGVRPRVVEHELAV